MNGIHLNAPGRSRPRTGLWLGAALLLGLGGMGCQNNGGLCDGVLEPCGQTVCADLTSDGLNCGACGVACRTTEVCSDSACICAPGTQKCAGECTAIQSDPQNCGGCGVACTAGNVCVSGACQPEIPL